MYQCTHLIIWIVYSLYLVIWCYNFTWIVPSYIPHSSTLPVLPWPHTYIRIRGNDYSQFLLFTGIICNTKAYTIYNKRYNMLFLIWVLNMSLEWILGTKYERYMIKSNFQVDLWIRVFVWDTWKGINESSWLLLLSTDYACGNLLHTREI